jgi:hypothetical protein
LCFQGDHQRQLPPGDLCGARPPRPPLPPPLAGRERERERERETEREREREGERGRPQLRTIRQAGEAGHPRVVDRPMVAVAVGVVAAVLVEVDERAFGGGRLRGSERALLARLAGGGCVVGVLLLAVG